MGNTGPTRTQAALRRHLNLRATHLSDQQIILVQLESHLWESANILRGPVGAADFKTYIFPLLSFKRICDVWDEEYQERLQLHPAVLLREQG